MFKNSLTIILCAIVSLANAQTTTCDCKTKQGVYSVIIDGKITFKGKNTKGQFLYDLAITFKNEVNCEVFVPTIQFNDNDWILEPKVKLGTDAKSRKKPFRKLITSATQLKPSPGLDDLLFANMLMDYDIGEKACNLSVTIGYTEAIKK